MVTSSTLVIPFWSTMCVASNISFKRSTRIIYCFNPIITQGDVSKFNFQRKNTPRRHHYYHSTLKDPSLIKTSFVSSTVTAHTSSKRLIMSSLSSPIETSSSDAANKSNNRTDGDNSSAAYNENKCVPCSSLNPNAILASEEVQSRVKSSFPLWELLPQRAQDTAKSYSSSATTMYFMSRKFTARNFKCAMDALNKMGEIAERENHHPDFHLTNYREVEVIIFTHKLGGITENDFKLASMIDVECVPIEYSSKWLDNQNSVVRAFLKR